MNKREMIHMLIDKLLDVEETGTTKKLYFNYYSPTGVDFHFSEGNGSKEYVKRPTYVYTGPTWNIEEQVKIALKDIETIKNTPDVEPQINLNLSLAKARELGLIA